MKWKANELSAESNGFVTQPVLNLHLEEWCRCMFQEFLVWVISRKGLKMTCVKAVCNLAYNKLVSMALEKERVDLSFHFDGVEKFHVDGLTLADVMNQLGCRFSNLKTREFISEDCNALLSVLARTRSAAKFSTEQTSHRPSHSKRNQDGPSDHSDPIQGLQTAGYRRIACVIVDNERPAKRYRTDEHVAPFPGNAIHHLKQRNQEEDLYEIDYPDSGNEEMISYQERKRRERLLRENFSAADKALNSDWEVLYSKITGWWIDPGNILRQAKSSILFPNDYSWLHQFLVNNVDEIVSDVSNIEETNSIAFAMHWKALICCEVHFALKKSLCTIFPGLKVSIAKYRDDVEMKRASTSFVPVQITKATQSRHLTNLTCMCKDSSLNVRIPESLAGMTVCAGYAKNGQTNCESGLLLFLVRSVHCEDAAVDKTGIERGGGRVLDRLTLSICGNLW